MMKLLALSFLCFLFIGARNSYTVITVLNDTTVTGSWDLNGNILDLTRAKVLGTCTISNGIIMATPFTQIFDTTVTIGTNISTREFSGMWYGAKPANGNNTRQLQYAIDASINRPYGLYIPAGSYTIAQPLMFAKRVANSYLQAKIKVYGDASFWDNGYGGTQIIYTGDSCALGFQLNKGSKVSGLWITGGWVSPGGSDTTYYNISSNSYTNQSGSGNGQGIWVDFAGNFSGSTGLVFENIKVEKFNTLIKISGLTSSNGEIITFRDLQLGDGKYGIYTSQPQEKANRFYNINSWGSIYTLITVNSGNYIFDGANIAGRCINIFNINTSGWFPSYVRDFYAENFATVGTVNTTMPCSFEDCIFDPIYKSTIGAKTLFSGNTEKIVFQNSIFRYYGSSDAMTFAGKATMLNCAFSTSSLSGISQYIFLSYSNSTLEANGTNITRIIVQDTSYRMNNIQTIIKRGRN